jgi:cytochrome b pre-mRNA-processing protein 3
MIWPLFRRNERPDTISSLYGMIVAQARLPVFYRDYGVADTVNGRFDMLLLHLALVQHRVWDDPEGRRVGQALFDRFCRDMDHNLREMGVGYLAVPREMERVGEAFYGRAKAYSAALAGGDEALMAAALIRNVYGGQQAASAGRLAAYVREAVRGLMAQEVAGLANGLVRFPDPSKTP